ncbi:MAG: hypothetical protein JWN48_1440 [Myxococcaceae bacterium]|nr:hypothetical protein [Myxococcaceae bacterium]
MLRTELLIAAFRALLVVASLCWAPCARAPLAHADELSEFESARARYDRHDYARSVDAFRKLVGSDPPRLNNTLLVLESRKYYAASLLFVGAEEEARLQFRLLLQQEPDYGLDPLAFPTEVVDLFDQVKASLRRDLDQKREAELRRQWEAEAEARAREQLRQQNLERLRVLAEEREVRRENSRWIATVPFGAGQFQNGHRRLGLALAVTESLAAATSVVTFIGHQSFADDQPSASDRDSINRRQRAWFTANIVSSSAFAALALLGVLDAHVRFVPDRVTITPRPLPLDLDRWVKEQAQRLTAKSAP